jgi:hypothetical protein
MWRGRGMKKETVSGFMITLIIVSVLTLEFNIQPVKASGTIYIEADGSVEGTTYIACMHQIFSIAKKIGLQECKHEGEVFRLSFFRSYLIHL